MENKNIRRGGVHGRTPEPAPDTSDARARETVQQSPQAEPDPAHSLNLLVTDPTAVSGGPVRVHEILIDGKPMVYRFNYNTPIPMPFAHAMKFLKAGFIVTDANGKTVTGVPSNPDPHQTEKFTLKGDELVARYDELKSEALLIRVNQTLGGERFHRNSDPAAMIAFLKAERARNAATGKTRNDGVGGGDAEDMSPAEIDKMFHENAA